ncbi:hypothetical protein G4H71_13465 [Rhodococcus triatomae]|uniref:Uncharacterized protein n=1 Tax=Rhodococcus triatomae TaxID=300028 RepID=A0A1G8H6Z8_9NOCA|nr:hypothetical protein [Rhodococcus triatomae]QNG20188.1 hypothetical protein G4H72_16915 [Rhodococcus triatomae]QNG23897.1 hypothetical protein G4H71_13465 [Rhodococcus triatomae]SDI02393.1 hypothetical protein SAMN05444695_104338 [Rhodococcus triatomae]
MTSTDTRATTMTVSLVRAWRPADLTETARGTDMLVERFDAQVDRVRSDHYTLTETWSGDAAEAADHRIAQECKLASAISEALAGVAAAYRDGEPALAAARANVLGHVEHARWSGFYVMDNGEVTLPPETAGDAATIATLREEAEAQTALVQDALRQAVEVSMDVTAALRSATEILDDAAAAARVGQIVEDGDGFSWAPDVPATVAASVVGTMSSAIGDGLKSVADSADNASRTIAKGMRPFGTVLGTIPAISNDIKGGMDPTKAVVTESVGAAAGALTGVWAGAKAGALVGSGAAPGVGTVVGFGAGAATGLIVGYAVPKAGQYVWGLFE